MFAIMRFYYISEFLPYVLLLLAGGEKDCLLYTKV